MLPSDLKKIKGTVSLLIFINLVSRNPKCAELQTLLTSTGIIPSTVDD